MKFPNEQTVRSVKEMYPAGCRIVLDHMEDPYRKIAIGSQGTVRAVDDIATIMPSWDEGGSLGVAYGEDSCHKIHTEEEALVTISWYGKHQPEKDTLCPRCGKLMEGPVSRHALSRWADIIVCDECGMVEALEKAGLTEVRPLMNWACIEGPQKGEGAWRG